MSTTTDGKPKSSTMRAFETVIVRDPLREASCPGKPRCLGMMCFPTLESSDYYILPLKALKPRYPLVSPSGGTNRACRSRTLRQIETQIVNQVYALPLTLNNSIV